MASLGRQGRASPGAGSSTAAEQRVMLGESLNFSQLPMLLL